MSTSAEVAFIKLICVRADILALDVSFRAGDRDARFFGNLRGALVALVNVDDVRGEVAPSLRGRPELARQSRELGRRLEPVRRLRNVIGGHLSNEIVAIALREEPILLRAGMTHDAIQYLAAIRLVDAALNSQLDSTGKPALFGGDTDLVYPPDMERFLSWLEAVVGGALDLLSASIQELESQIQFVGSESELMERYKRAGEGPAGRPTK